MALQHNQNYRFRIDYVRHDGQIDANDPANWPVGVRGVHDAPCVHDDACDDDVRDYDLGSFRVLGHGLVPAHVHDDLAYL